MLIVIIMMKNSLDIKWDNKWHKHLQFFVLHLLSFPWMYTIFSNKIKYCNKMITPRIDFLFDMSSFIKNVKYLIQYTLSTYSWSNILSKDEGRFSKYSYQLFLGICFCQLWIIGNSLTLMSSSIYICSKMIDYYNIQLNPSIYFRVVWIQK